MNINSVSFIVNILTLLFFRLYDIISIHIIEKYLPLTREYKIVSSGAFKEELVRTSFHVTT